MDIEIATRIRLAGQAFSIMWFITTLLCLYGKMKNPIVNVGRYVLVVLGILVSIGHFIIVTFFPIDLQSEIYSRLVFINTLVVVVTTMTWASGRTRPKKTKGS